MRAQCLRSRAVNQKLASGQKTVQQGEGVFVTSSLAAESHRETSFVYDRSASDPLLDAESGLHYNYFRTYDPSTGRYLESDPIGLSGGLNPYAYVESNPLNGIDALGQSKLRGRINPNAEPTIEELFAAKNVPPLVAQIQEYDPEFVYARSSSVGYRYNRHDEEFLRDILGQQQSTSQCTGQPTRINYGSTPAGRPLTRHYSTEFGPSRNIPGSLVDDVIENQPGRPDNGATVRYDPANDVTVVEGRNGIMSVHRGPPRVSK